MGTYCPGLDLLCLIKVSKWRKKIYTQRIIDKLLKLAPLLYKTSLAILLKSAKMKILSW